MTARPADGKAAALKGETCQREMPLGAARLARRGAA
jgi:hypothetical protein